MAPELISLDGAEHASAPGKLRILISAYACEPHKGSEPGIGWNWATALAGAGHEVWVITRANNRAVIEDALQSHSAPDLHFVYHDLPGWMRWWKRGGRGVRLYYVLWQWGAYRLARILCRELPFDVVHHLTFGVFRHPSFMAFLDAPFVFGPVGGGETAPRELRRTFPPRGYVADLARDLANGAVRLDPVMNAVYRRSAVILCKTHETLARIPQRFHDKCLVHPEVGTHTSAAPCAPAHRANDGAFQVLYVGRLVYWKGVHLALMAFARFLESHGEARMTIVGSGPDERWLRRLAQRLALGGSVRWVPWLERDQVMRAYPEHDVFLFPSLHDSSGNAVLEALSCALPVVCVDVGGPALLVDGASGIRVAPGAPDAVVAGLARALARLARNAELRRSMGEAAVRRAHEHYAWASQAARMERLYRSLQHWRPSGRYSARSPLERRTG